MCKTIHWSEFGAIFHSTIQISSSPREAEHVSNETKRHYRFVTVYFQDCLRCGDQTRLSNRQRWGLLCALNQTTLIVYVRCNLLNVFIILWTLEAFSFMNLTKFSSDNTYFLGSVSLVNNLRLDMLLKYFLSWSLSDCIDCTAGAG